MIKVCKFGGSSLSDAPRVVQVCQIVKSDPLRRIVVVSAPGKRDSNDTKVTDLLIECARLKLAGQDTVAIRAQVLERFRLIQQALALDESLIRGFETQLSDRLAADASQADQFLDGVKALGEDFSARLVAAALAKEGLPATYVNPGDAGLRLSGEAGNAHLDPTSYQRLALLRDHDGIVVFPGFFGYTEAGAIATFPRGGSDITGAILAAAVGAAEYENFTDVDSVYVVDPRLVPEVSHAIERLTYREMRELAYAGFGVFHEEAVLPAIHAQIPIHVRNTQHPEKSGTLIVSTRKAQTGAIVGIAAADGFCCIYIDKFLMNREIGFGRRLLEIFEAEGVSYEHMPSGIDNVSVLVEQADFDADTEARVLERIRTELLPDALMVERDHALIMVVGEGMQYTVGLAAKATHALAQAGVNIEMMNQGASEISMMFGVRSADLSRAVRALYQTFFNGEIVS